MRFIPLGIIIVLWFIVGNALDSPLFVPTPQAVLRGAADLLANGMLAEAALKSFWRISLASLLSAAVSIPIGLLIVNYRWADALVSPLTGFMRYLPITAFYPLLMMWFGIGETMRVMFLFLATFVYFLPTVVLCVKDIAGELIETAYTIGMSKLQVIWRVIIPAMAPSISQSFLMMYGIGWTYVVVAELVNAQAGLGFIINTSGARGRTDLVYVAIISILLISYLFDSVRHALIKKFFRWKFVKQSYQ